MIMAGFIRCACCNSELTAPQFYNGLPYGWSCIKKIVPNTKQNKRKFVAVDNFKVITGNTGQRKVIRLEKDGKVYKHVFYCRSAEASCLDSAGSFYQNGTLFVAEDYFK